MGDDKVLQIVIKAKNQADKGLSSAAKSVGSLGKAAISSAIAVAAAAAAAAGVFVDLSLAGERMATANARIENITQSMSLFGDQAGAVSVRVIKLAEAQARATGVDTNAIKTTAAKLLTFKNLAKTANEAGGMFDRATKAAVDLAAAGFGTAETNAVSLGKALQDPIKGLTALGRQGVTFTEQEKAKVKALMESGKVAQAQTLIMKAIETQVGGTAVATSNASDKMKVAFEQVKERIGTKLLPTFEKLTKWVVDKALPAFEKFIDGLDFAKIGRFARTLLMFTSPAGMLIANFKTIQTVAQRVWKVVGPVFAKMGAIIGGAFKDAIDNLKEAWATLWPQIAPAMPLLKKVGMVMLALAAAPVVVLVAAITGIVLVFSKVVQGVTWAIKKFVEFMGKFKEFAAVVGTNVAKVVDTLAQLPKRAYNALKNLASIIRGPIDKAIAVLKELNPFTRHSPSLVDNVIAGVAVIASKYAGLSGIRIKAPVMGALVAPSMAFAGAGASVAGAASGTRDVVAHIYLDGRELTRSTAKVATTNSRSGAR